MHRNIVSALLVIHLLFMILVVSFNSKFDFSNKGMMVAAIFALYLLLLITYFRTRAMHALVMLGIVLYFLMNVTSFLLFVLRQFSSLKLRDILIFSFVFIPGTYCSFAYFIYLVRDHKNRRAAAQQKT